MRSLITSDAFSPDAELSSFAAGRNGNAGALASFVGYCRGDDGIEWLELQHYSGFTEAEVARLARAVAVRYGLIDLIVIHRVGAIPTGDPIVLVAALSRHRAGAFAAVSEMMDYLKTDAPIWKREVGAQSARWVEPTAEDHARRQDHAK